MFLVTLSSRAEQSAIQRQSNAHRAWLAHHTSQGRFIAAGPLASGEGGVIVAHGDQQSELEAVLSSDPFVALGLVDVTVQAWTPAIRHDEFPARWAQGATSLAG
nr:YciI family protein [Pelomonas sp. P8]